MLGQETKEDDIVVILPTIDPQFEGVCSPIVDMHEGAILIAGVGGLGCSWAVAAHQQCLDLSDLLLIDADEPRLGALVKHIVCTLMQLGTEVVLLLSRILQHIG